MKGIKRYNLKRFCIREGVDTQEIDSSITYYENKAHLDTFELDKKISPPSQAYLNWVSQAQKGRLYNKYAVCPKCGLLGSGLHVKWVLNCQKRKYYPYYYFAHSVKAEGSHKVKWCYIRKKLALELLADYDRKKGLGLK